MNFQCSPLASLASRIRARRAGAHDAHHEHELNCTALCCACSGQCAIVSRLVGCEKEAARLRDLGLREGAIVTVVRDGDPLVVGVEDARFGIGRSAAMNILCQIVE
jgi:Fe2+ transport system protein FeoA